MERAALDVGWLLHRHLAAFNAAVAAAAPGDAAALAREYRRRAGHPAAASAAAEETHLLQVATALLAALLPGRDYDGPLLRHALAKGLARLVLPPSLAAGTDPVRLWRAAAAMLGPPGPEYLPAAALLALYAAGVADVAAPPAGADLGAPAPAPPMPATPAAPARIHTLLVRGRPVPAASVPSGRSCENRHSAVVPRARDGHGPCVVAGPLLAL